MKLISDIINELVDGDKLLAGPLLKTKVPASRINNSELYNWVNGELKGYKDSIALPEYRISSGTLMGTYKNGPQLYKNCQIPIGDIPDKLYSSITAIKIIDSISSIEKMTTNEHIVVTVSPDTRRYLESSIQAMGNRFYEILNLHLTVGVALLPNIISSVRSKLLDFMLEIEKKFGQESEINDLTQNPEFITHIMNTTINNNGDANVINTGDKAKIVTSNSVKKGDKTALAKVLKENGVSDKDIEQLLSVVDDTTPIEKDKFSLSVNNWIKKMMDKAIDGSWQIGIGAAGSLIATALSAHYGWK